MPTCSCTPEELRIPQRWSPGERQNSDHQDIRDSEGDKWVTYVPEAGREQGRAQEKGQSHRGIDFWKDEAGGDGMRSPERGAIV